MTPLASVLITILLGIIAWIGKEMVAQLKSIASSVNDIKIQIGVLSNDHNNLRDDHNELKSRVHDLEHAK